MKATTDPLLRQQVISDSTEGTYDIVVEESPWQVPAYHRSAELLRFDREGHVFAKTCNAFRNRHLQTRPYRYAPTQLRRCAHSARTRTDNVIRRPVILILLLTIRTSHPATLPPGQKKENGWTSLTVGSPYQTGEAPFAALC